MKKFRDKIDEIDEKIAVLFQKRMNLVRKILDYKDKNNMKIYDRQRQSYILDKIKGFVDFELYPFLKQWYKFLFKVTCEFEEKLLEEKNIC